MLLDEHRVVKHELRVVSGDLVGGVFHGVYSECKHVWSLVRVRLVHGVVKCSEHVYAAGGVHCDFADLDDTRGRLLWLADALKTQPLSML